MHPTTRNSIAAQTWAAKTLIRDGAWEAFWWNVTEVGPANACRALVDDWRMLAYQRAKGRA
jgi:hypothetical protein